MLVEACRSLWRLVEEMNRGDIAAKKIAFYYFLLPSVTFQAPSVRSRKSFVVDLIVLFGAVWCRLARMRNKPQRREEHREKF